MSGRAWKVPGESFDGWAQAPEKMPHKVLKMLKFSVYTKLKAKGLGVYWRAMARQSFSGTAQLDPLTCGGPRAFEPLKNGKRIM